MSKEPKLLQELGPKKYRQKMESTNKFYDNHMAGKRNPKTGELYHHISFTDPNKRTNTGKAVGEVECAGCGYVFSVKRSSVMIICSHCKQLNKIKFTEDGEAEASLKDG